ncbi:Uncharacterized conserved protein [Arenibacter nanhaiticus]|uniref:Uncharacterized conserved protein n=1 Tax=Arenibacter nanhaiticus TaxID=558155 RepID=A0A1M6HHV9_9FLAO|nr:phosphatase domain-containing protein [Arenibacter nanhaiticus]SHJ21699.1 Uncharacterized conserved protein [Arenibacter nanhaiticus]
MWFLKKADPLQLIGFQTYGTDTHLYIKGRALEDENIDLSEKSVLGLLVNTWKRFETDVVGNSKLILKLPDGKEHSFKTNREGYFYLYLTGSNLRAMCNKEGWLSYELSFADTTVKRKIIQENRFPGEMLIPAVEADFGIISDIDDTILHTGVVSLLKWRVIYNTFLKTPENRIPLKGASDFYHLLHRGCGGNNANPIFYVSNSPWNLYRYLEFFLKNNNFPRGPILLRSFRALFKKAASWELSHKYHEIQNILKTFPQLSIILIGDAGESDADIYREIARKYPKRILAIYLHSVKHRKKMDRIRNLYKDFKACPVLLVENSDQAIEHARKNGFIK